MLAFIAVMTYVDINLHSVDAKTIGAFFDRIHNSALADQRLLWAFPLIVLVVKGAGLCVNRRSALPDLWPILIAAFDVPPRAS